MRQVIKHRDIRLLKMIRRTDPVIPVTSHGKSEKDEKKLVSRLYIFAKSGNI